jgi:hypothetical protein
VTTFNEAHRHCRLLDGVIGPTIRGMYYRRLVSMLAVMAAVGIIWGVVLIGFLLAGVELLPLGIAAGVEAVLVLPSFLFGVVTNSKATGPRRFGPRTDPLELFRVLPRWLRWASGVLFFACLLSGATAFIGVGGNAEIQNGQYVLADHGTITVVDKATYERQLAQQDRIAMSVLGAFGVGGAVLCLVSSARGRVG